MTERERKLVEAARMACKVWPDHMRGSALEEALKAYTAPHNPVFSQDVNWDSRADRSIGMTLDAIEAHRDKAGDWK